MKRFLFWIENRIWSIKCSYGFWMHGPYGLSKEIEKMPFRYVNKYLKKYGATIGENCIIDSGFKIHRPNKSIPFKNLIIGNNVYIGHNLLVDLTDKVIFEDDSALSANCLIWTHVGDYKYNLRDKDDYWEKVDKVIFKKGFVGYAGSIYNPGAILGKYSRVLASSMVSGTIPEKEIWGGIPAKYIKKRDF